MKKIVFIVFCILIFSSFEGIAQITERERPSEWNDLVFGARFMDRFLPMPDLGGITSETWGAPGVIPRDVNNGIEDPKWSYWGGNIRLMEDGKYHLFVCRWPENSPKGHMEWGNSDVVHTVADMPTGPFKVISEIGKGHNPEWYITREGKFVIYVIDGYYLAANVNGPWEYNKFDFDERDREIIEGLSNLTFAQREDGSYLMICRGGGVWISKDGLSTWNQVSDSRVYPPVDGRFEDPLIWKTNIQYHLIVNDWLGRIAWYLRSKDGIHWKVDPGEAYMPGIALHENGLVEEWFKFERIKVLQDEYGRAIQANFAVIDTVKWEDRANDNHSSKNITIPLVVGKLITVLNKKPINERTKEISVLVQAEEGFDPNNDIDLETLRFGASEEVNFGRGCKVKQVKRDGSNIIITFYGEGNGITDDNFAGKLLGKDKNGKLLFGFTRLPGVNYNSAILSARKPIFDAENKSINVDVENFGQVISTISSIELFKIEGELQTSIAKGIIQPLDPYQRETISLKGTNEFYKSDEQKYLLVINAGKTDEVLFHFSE